MYLCQPFREESHPVWYKDYPATHRQRESVRIDEGRRCNAARH